MASELFASECPLYCICHLGGEEFCVTGGGGKAKTGVPNLLEVYRLSHDGLHFLAERVHRHSWDTQVVMDASPHPQEPHILAAGIGDSCYLLSIRTEKMKEDEATSGADGLEVCMLRSVQTDFDKEEPCQEVVRFSHDGSLVVTGGTDGVVRCWKYPSLKKSHELTGHKTEIGALACHPHELQAVSVCRHGNAIVWDLEKGKKEAEFTWSPDSRSQKKTYRFRACCFSPKTEESPALFFSINIPLKSRPRQKGACYIIKWDADSWQPIRSQKTGNELLSALAVDPTGSWLGVATGDGSVAVYNSNLNLIKVSRVHSLFVTDLAFVTAASQTVKVVKPAKQADAAQPQRTVLLSVSADKLCCVTDLKRRGLCRTDTVTLVLIPVLVLLIAMVIKMLSGSL